MFKKLLPLTFLLCSLAFATDTSPSPLLFELKASHEFSCFYDLVKITSLPDAHPQTKRILETRIFSFIDSPFAISSSLALEGQIFYFTNIFKGPANEHDLVIMFAKNKTGLYVPRLLYKSISNGGWRVCPKIEVINNQGYFSKGLRVHYTQETKPIEEIILHLEKAVKIPILVFNISEKPYKKIEQLFDLDFFLDPKLQNDESLELQAGVYTYEEEISIYDSKQALKPLQDYQPGAGFKSKTTDAWGEGVAETNDHSTASIYRYLKSLSYPQGFLPNFLQPAERHYKFTHTLLGMIEVKVFIAKLDGQDIEWHLAYDQQGRIWIDRINFLARQINSYGLSSLVIDSGLLTNKPLEYALQLDLLLDTVGLANEEILRPFSGEQGKESEIYDLSPLLDTLLPIKKFREAQGIVRAPE